MQKKNKTREKKLLKEEKPSKCSYWQKQLKKKKKEDYSFRN